MNELSSSDELIRIIAANEHCFTILADWEWWAGRHVTAEDFCPSQIQRYLDALGEVLTADDVEEVRSKIVSVWRRAYVCGIVSTSPEDLTSGNTSEQ